MPPRKRFAQHWLRSEKALNRIVTAAQLQASDRLLEIGPGQGALTGRLLPAAAALLAIEIDRDLCRLLAKKFGDRENFLLLQGDILSLDWETCIQDFPAFQAPNKVVANIPYNITGPILELLLGTIAQPRSHPFDAIVLLMQKEVALRLCAQPGNRNFGALTVRVGFLADCEWVCDVPAKAFDPPPKVDSAVVRLVPRPFAPAPQSPSTMEKLLHLGFASRRKMLRNNLNGIVSPEQLTTILTELGVRPDARAETLGILDWVRLSDRLAAHPPSTTTNQPPPQTARLHQPTD